VPRGEGAGARVARGGEARTARGEEADGARRRARTARGDATPTAHRGSPEERDIPQIPEKAIAQWSRESGVSTCAASYRAQNAWRTGVSKCGGATRIGAKVDASEVEVDAARRTIKAG